LKNRPDLSLVDTFDSFILLLLFIFPFNSRSLGLRERERERDFYFKITLYKNIKDIKCLVKVALKISDSILETPKHSQLIKECFPLFLSFPFQSKLTHAYIWRQPSGSTSQTRLFRPHLHLKTCKSLTNLEKLNSIHTGFY